MKRFLSFLIALSMLFALVSCGDTAVTSSDGTSSEAVSEASSEEETSSEETSSVYVEDPANVALGKRTYRSSEADLMPSTKLTDGEKSGAWSSDTTTESIDEWVAVDLGKNYNLETVNIFWGMSYSPEFSVEISRGGVEYTEIFSTTDNKGGTSAIAADGKVARYIRVKLKSVVSVLDTFMGAAIQEIEVAATVADDQTLGSETEEMVITKVVSIEESDVLRGGRSYEFNTLAAAGSTYEYQCTGRAAGAVITGNGGIFEVCIDGGDYKSYSVKKGTVDYLFTDELDEGVHTVRITRRSDPWTPVFTVDEIIVEETADIVKGYKGDYDLKIEFIGDSITSAQGVDYSLSYVVVASKLLNAHFQVVSRSGMGLYRNAGNGGPSETLPEHYQWTEYQSKKKDVEYTYHADVVVLNIGTNDGGNLNRYVEGEADKEAYIVEFEKLYYDMLDEVLVANPNASVLCVYGQLGTNSKILASIKKVAESYKADHPDVNIDVFNFQNRMDEDPEGSGHPGPQSHERDGKALADKIKELLEK